MHERERRAVAKSENTLAHETTIDDAERPAYSVNSRARHTVAAHTRGYPANSCCCVAGGDCSSVLSLLENGEYI